jgi:hypothetical protein
LRCDPADGISSVILVLPFLSRSSGFAHLRRPDFLPKHLDVIVKGVDDVGEGVVLDDAA